MTANSSSPFAQGAEAWQRPSTDEVSAVTYDVVVIGGGINGAGIARAAALAGYRVLVLEQRDFGWGTTWRSTKLIHGGLRYLEHAEFGLVFESLRDQALLLREYPDMVRTLTLLLPLYQGSRHGPAAVELGLTLYDLLAYRRRLPGHRRHGARGATRLEPALNPRRLRAAFTYADCQVEYPERLCMQTLHEARAAGAVVLNHAEVTRLLTHRAGHLLGVEVNDHEAGVRHDVTCRAVVNAAGPWVDRALRSLGGAMPEQIGGTKGAHMVVDYGTRGPLMALFAEARADGRPFFIVPWRGRHLIGTTDTRFTGPPDDVCATGEDVNYLLQEANLLLPRTPISLADVHYAYAGVRPLPATSDIDTGAITRRHIVHDHAVDGHPGLISIIGGKLSTYRSLASQVVNHLRRQLTPTGSSTPAVPAVSIGVTADIGLSLEWIVAFPGPILLDHLRSLYGPRVGSVVRLLVAHPELRRRLCVHGPDTEAQVVVAVQEEGARTVADTLLRRVGAGWNACLGLDCSQTVARIMGRELGWQAERIVAEVRAYAAEVERTFLSPGRCPVAATVASQVSETAV